MKYISLLLMMSMIFVLSSCFQKPSDTQDTSTNTGTSVVDEEDENMQEDTQDDNSQEESMDDENSEGEETPDDTTEVEASGSVSVEDQGEDEEVVIEEIEAELEELFSDLLGEDEQK